MTERFERMLRDAKLDGWTVTEADVREGHRFVGIDVASGRIQEGVVRCSCGATFYDPDGDCPVMEDEIDALRARPASA